MKKEVYLAGDHAGFELKEKIKLFLEKNKIKFKDLGPDKFEENDDYPDFVKPLTKMVLKNNSIGLIFAGSGNGEAMVANRTRNIRAAVYYGKNLEIVRKAREHNNANILSIGARYVDQKETEEAIKIFLKTKFLKGKHLRRIKKF